MATDCLCYAALEASAPLVPHKIKRRAVGPNDVAIDIKYAGICHSDIHQAREEWGPAIFPMVPGHEIAGFVKAVGSKVKNFSVGDRVGVGCMVDSCRQCEECKKGEEQYCIGGGMIGTYNSRFKYEHCEECDDDGGAPTYGGYSQSIVVDKNYVLKVPDGLSLPGAAPLLCAGITVYSPMMYYGLRPGMKFGVAGLGGLGAMAVKIGKAMGVEVTVLSRSEAKKAEALEVLGAHKYVSMGDEKQVAAAAGSLDMILNCISADFDVGPYMNLLKKHGKQICVGLPTKDMSMKSFAFVPSRKMLAGSLIGGIHETQEMLDFCALHGIECPHELISAEKINEAYEGTVKGAVRYRYVIDTATFTEPIN